MAISQQTETSRPEWLVRMLRIRYVVAVTALIFVVMIAIGALTGPSAVGAFALIVIAAAIAVGGEDVARAIDPPPLPVRAGDASIEALVAALPDPIVAMERDGVVVAFNTQAGALAPGLRIGEPVSLALRMPHLIEAIRRALATGTTQRVEIAERVPLDRSYEVFVAPVALRGETRADLVLLTFHDLTAIRRVEEMRADFVANASHELRTPLAALLGFIETLQGPARNDTAAREKFLAIMQTQATRMARLIDDLLSLSRIELNAHQRPDTPVDLVAVVRQVADGLQTLARDRDVEVLLEAPPEPLLVLGSRDELARLVENLVENALKYGANGKRVELRVAREEVGGKDGVSLAVRDHGPGIAPEHLPRLTERFYRVDVAESRAQGGTGLGLALVKHILNRHGGRLAIESRQGQGATFIIRLPLITGRASVV